MNRYEAQEIVDELEDLARDRFVDYYTWDDILKTLDDEELERYDEAHDFLYPENPIEVEQ